MANNEEGEEHVNEWEVPSTAVNEEGGEAVPRGNDWEVVSLTASTYAAAPGPRGNESIHQDSESNVHGNNEAETSRALFMSGHFAFPPSEHENLPIATEKLETPIGGKQDDLVAEINVLKEGKREEKIDEKWGVEGLNVKEGFPGISLFEEKGHMTLSSIDPEFEPYGQRGLNVDEKEQDLYGATKLSSFHSAAVIGDPDAFDRSVAVNNLVEASDDVIDPSYLRSKAPKSVKEDEDDDSKLPCGAWWKRGVAALYAQAKDTSAFWSIFVAAAVMGLVVLGHRWQQERLQILHHRWQLSIDNEKSGRIISRVKDVIVDGSRRGTSVTTVSTEL